MATQRQTIGDQLGAAIRTLKARAVAALLAPRSDPNAQLSDGERETLFGKMWKAIGAALTPISPDGSISISTQNDADGVPQLALTVATGAGRKEATVPKALYQFWRGSTYGLKDASGNGRNLAASVGSAVVGELPSFGAGLVFNGTTMFESSDTSGLFQTPGDLSFVVAFKMTEMPSEGSYRPLVMVSSNSENDNIIVNVTSDGSLLVYHEYGAWSGGTSASESHVLNTGIQVNTLYWLALVRKGKTLTAYVNGANCGTATLGNLPTNCANNRFSVGGAVAYPTFGIKAVIASVAFYNAALDPTETTELFRSEMMSWGNRAGSGGDSADDAFTEVSVASNVISGFGAHRNLLVTGGGTIKGIDATGVPAGAILQLTFAEATTIAAMQTSTGQKIKTPPLTPSGSPEDISVLADDMLRLQNRSDQSPGYWNYVGGTR
jgi:hypothetical protein